MKKWSIVIIIAVAVALVFPTLLPTTTSAQDDGADWLAMAYVAETDTIHWFNVDGEVSSIPRPKIDNELEFSSPRIHVSRDGRYLIIAADLNTGVSGIGFYDLAAEQFTQVYQTESGEQIHLGGRYSSSIFGRRQSLAFRHQLRIHGG